MRKTKHFLLALLAVTGLSTAWASGLSGNTPDNDPAKATYSVVWTGVTDTTYTGGQMSCLSASYNNGTTNVPLTLTYTRNDINGNPIEVVTSGAPVNAGSWNVVANPPSGVTLTGNTNTLNIHPAKVYVTDAAARLAKFADNTSAGIVTNQGTIHGVLAGDNVTCATSAIFGDLVVTGTDTNFVPATTVGKNKTISFYYALVGDLNKVNNYSFVNDTHQYTHYGEIIEGYAPDLLYGNLGFNLPADGFCAGAGYTIPYQLVDGRPDQYRIDFASDLIPDVNWCNLLPGDVYQHNGSISFNLPDADLPANTSMNVYFRDSRLPYLESQPLTVVFGMNLPSSYTMPLFDNVIALVDTCNCFTDIQWYHSTDGGATWTAIPGANGYYYYEANGLTGQYKVSAKKDGVNVWTCPQTDVATLVTDPSSASMTVNAYPNPTTENVTISISGSENAIHTFTVISTLGVEMMRGAFSGDQYTLDMSNYQRGSYMLNVDGKVVRVIKNNN